MKVKGLKELKKELKTKKIVAMIAPSFAAELDFKTIVSRLKKAGFDKVVELTFGAKLVNKEYHNLLNRSNGLIISSTCAGIQEALKGNKNLARIDSPMIATAKICRKIYSKHKLCFISPCEFKKIEAGRRGYVDYVINYFELHQLIDDIKGKKWEEMDRFYNDYTKIYPLAGGLSKTAHLKGVLNQGQEKIIDGIVEVRGFLIDPDNNIKFLDANFCVGGCIGGPCLSGSVSLAKKRKRILKYLKWSEKQKISENRKGLLEKAKGLKFTY